MLIEQYALHHRRRLREGYGFKLPSIRLVFVTNFYFTVAFLFSPFACKSFLYILAFPFGVFTFACAAVPLNAPAPTPLFVNFVVLIVMLFKFLQLANAPFCMVVTLLGMTILVTLVQFLKAFAPMI